MDIEPPPSKGLYLAYAVCWLLGIGSLFSWNSVLTMSDYYSTVFPQYHPTRVLTLVYQPFALLTLSILAYREDRVKTQARILFGYILFFIASIVIPLVDISTSGQGGIGPYFAVCLASALFGIADAHVQGGMIGDLSYMRPEFIQSFLAGLAASGAATSGLRMITKASFETTRGGLRKGALLFLFISAFFVLCCIFLYAYIFPKLEIVKHYRTKAALEGTKTVVADLAAGGLSSKRGGEEDLEEDMLSKRISNPQLIVKNIDFLFSLFMVYTLSLSIFPGFLAEDTGKHHLGSWYVITLIAMFNVGDFLSRYIPLVDLLRLESRVGLVCASISRFIFIPLFYLTARYGTQGWMIFLCIALGISNGYLTVCILVTAPRGYKGPEQNALGNILVLALLFGILTGVTSDWLWLIGKGW